MQYSNMENKLTVRRPQTIDAIKINDRCVDPKVLKMKAKGYISAGILLAATALSVLLLFT